MKTSALIDRYTPFVGKRVAVYSPGYAALDAQQADRVITGVVQGLAHRENGVMTGEAYDMVIRDRQGALRTINLRRIVRVELLGL